MSSSIPIDLMSSSDDSDDEVEVLDSYASAKSQKDNQEVRLGWTSRNATTSEERHRRQNAQNTASICSPASTTMYISHRPEFAKHRSSYVPTTTRSFPNVALAKEALREKKRFAEMNSVSFSHAPNPANNTSLPSRKRALPHSDYNATSYDVGSQETPIEIDFSLAERQNPAQKDSSPDERKATAARNREAKQPTKPYRPRNFGPQRALCTGRFADNPIDLYNCSSDSDDTDDDSSVQRTYNSGWKESDDRFRKELAQNLANRSRTPPRENAQTPNSADPKSARRLLAMFSPVRAKHHRAIVPDNRARPSPLASKIAAARPMNRQPFPKQGRSARALSKWPPFARSALEKSTLNEVSAPIQKEASVHPEAPLPDEERLPATTAETQPTVVEQPNIPAKDRDHDLVSRASDAESLRLLDTPCDSASLVESSLTITGVSDSMALRPASKSPIEAPDSLGAKDTTIELHSPSTDLVALDALDVHEVCDSSVSVAMEHGDSASDSDQQVESTIVFPDDHIPPSKSKKTDSISNEEAQEEEEDLPPWMNTIEHLSFKTTDPATGLPVHDFSVYGGDDSLVYRFRQFAAPSGIPGANYGAFIVFLGAWRLKDESAKLNRFLSDNLTYYEAPTRRPLQAVFKEGESGVTVRLTGKDLHGFKNRCYVPTDALRMLAEGSGKVKVRISREHLEIPLYEAYHLGESSVLKPVGHFGVHTQFDYERATSIKYFEVGDNCIDIGRYGPFRKQDRKPEDLFVLKAFIFSQLPSEYSFSVSEPLHGQIQNIDISSDVDGTPHDSARSEIPMYVNEVGHSGKFKQNVFSRESGDRVVKYYFIPNETMEIGKPVEMLTDYKNHYEFVRERHGYGRRNINDGLSSDRESFAALLERNFSDREDVQHVIRFVNSIQRLRDLLAYIYNEFWVPIMGQMQHYYDARISNSVPVPLTPAQWVAVRRISWMADEFFEWKEEWLKKNSRRPEDDEGIDSISRMLAAIKIECSLFRELLVSDYRQGGSVLDEDSRIALEDEYVEEICFELKDSLPKAFHESVYCSVARDLLRKLCKESQKWILERQTTVQLLEQFYDAAESARTAMSTGIDNGELDALAFGSGVQHGSVLSGSLSDILAVFKTSPAFYLQYNTTPKGVRAALIEACPKLEACDRNIEQDIGDRFIMANVHGHQNDHWTDYQHLAALGSIPVEQSKTFTANVNVMWYIHWQVLYLVDLFASRYCGADGYDIDTLCEKIGADRKFARFVVGRGIRENDGLGYRDFCHVKETSIARQGVGQCCRSQDSKELANQTIQLPLLSENTNSLYRRGKEPCILMKKEPSVLKRKEILQPENGENWTTQYETKSQPEYQFGLIPGENYNCIYKGPPKTRFPGRGDTWPEGWYQITEVRMGGDSRGNVDHYWYPSENAKRLRSNPDILRYLCQHNMDQYLP